MAEGRDNRLCVRIIDSSMYLHSETIEVCFMYSASLEKKERKRKKRRATWIYNDLNRHKSKYGSTVLSVVPKIRRFLTTRATGQYVGTAETGTLRWSLVKEWTQLYGVGDLQQLELDSMNHSSLARVSLIHKYFKVSPSSSTRTCSNRCSHSTAC